MEVASTHPSNRMERGMIDPKAQARFWSKVDRQGPDDCWEWQGGRKPKGYGLATLNGKTITANRAAYMIAHPGEDIKGLLIRHSCDNPPCCNPAHLSPGTAIDNAQDMMDRRRHAVFAMTHCKRGHERNADNCYERRGGWWCKICTNDRQRNRRARLRNAS